mgnify:CR=1 FL=1
MFYVIIEAIVKFNDGGYPIESEVVRMCVLPKSQERGSLLSALETIQLILSFGMFTIALIKLIVDLLKNDKKK